MTPPQPQLEMAHVLFMDLVGYSALPMEAQRQRLEELLGVVRQTAEFQGVAGREFLRLPTGDGMALVFFRDPVAPVRCALEVAAAVRGRPALRLRMGIHAGPVYRVEDINANANVAGGGINLAQQVMDFGDAGHILLSGDSAGFLQQVENWPLHDLGEGELKHGKRLRLFSLHSETVGNARLPERLRAPVGAAPREPGTAPRVALFYKRQAEPDARLLQLLETTLRERGCRVFVDRHLEIGLEWARGIDRQIRAADAVIPLLSAASIQSEMFTHEVQTAHEAFQEQGRPRLLPVRVAYAGPLPEALAAPLDPLEYALWQGPQDDEPVAAQLLAALERGATAAAAPRAQLEPVGGAVPLDSRFYVVRAADEEFRAAIARGGSIVLVKGARQMGKTSLLARGLQQAREAGARVARSDLQKLNQQHLESAGALFLQLADSLADQLRRILVLLARDPALGNVVRGILRGQPCPTPESFYRLRSAGVMAGESSRDVRPRCRLYEAYLTRHLL